VAIFNIHGYLNRKINIIEQKQKQFVPEIMFFSCLFFIQLFFGYGGNFLGGSYFIFSSFCWKVLSSVAGVSNRQMPAHSAQSATRSLTPQLSGIDSSCYTNKSALFLFNIQHYLNLIIYI
jgi:hypothetical protein